MIFLLIIFLCRPLDYLFLMTAFFLSILSWGSMQVVLKTKHFKGRVKKCLGWIILPLNVNPLKALIQKKKKKLKAAADIYPYKIYVYMSMSISIQKNIFALVTHRITDLRDNSLSVYGIHYTISLILDFGFKWLVYHPNPPPSFLGEQLFLYIVWQG